MRTLVAITVLLVATSAHASWIDSITNQISSLFQSYEEAPYSVTATYPGYEERVYPAQKWVCTEHTAHRDDDDVTSNMFWNLFRYISGNNSNQQKIEMTVPVTTEYTEGTTTNKYQMCFYIGAEHQDDPATPTEQQVTIQQRPEMTVLTRTVGGYMDDDEDWLEETNRLAEIINANGESVSLSQTYWVGYDAPFKFWNRRNEVWFVKN